MCIYHKSRRDLKAQGALVVLAGFDLGGVDEALAVLLRDSAVGRAAAGEGRRVAELAAGGGGAVGRVVIVAVRRGGAGGWSVRRTEDLADGGHAYRSRLRELSMLARCVEDGVVGGEERARGAESRRTGGGGCRRTSGAISLALRPERADWSRRRARLPRLSTLLWLFQRYREAEVSSDSFLTQ